MSDNQLVVTNKGALTQKIDQGDLGEILKPLINEIHLFDTFIAGTSFIEDTSLFENLEIGDNLSLLREENKFDSNAIMLLSKDRKKLGYIPEKDNVIFARLMDAGKMLAAKVKKIDRKGSFWQVAVGIYLVDF